MATANVKKQPPTPTTSSPARSYKPPGSARSSTPLARSNTPSKERDIHHSTDKKSGIPTTSTTPSPITKSGSPFSAKAVARRSTIITSPTSDLTDSQLENAVAMEDLKKKVAEAEAKNLAMEDDFAKQIKALQARIDEASTEQSKLEDLLAGKTDAAETLENDLKELQRAKRDQEKLFEAERTAFMTEKDEMSEKEEAQTQIIQRLKQALNSRDKPSSDVPDTVEGTGQKEKIIESLRSELAEAQTRFSEALKLEERKFQDATEQLAELRKSNAKLQDENESFQLLLGQATMNGDIRNGFLGQYTEDSDSASQTKQESLGSTLAEEIESASQKEEQDEYKKLENENKSLKDQNKAMTLYINTMIERLLNSNQENILDRTPANEKALPPVPQQESLPPVLPQRSKSILVKRPPIRASMPPPPRNTGVEEDDMISPITRRQTMHITSSTFTPGHRRSQSDTKSPTSPPANYSLVNPMYRMDGEGSPPSKQTTFYTGPRFGSNGPLSPGARGPVSSSNSSESGEATPRDPNDPNHHTLSGQMTGKTLRPLRLVEGPPKSTPRKVSENRTSWMGGWFTKAQAGGEDPVKPLTPAASTSSVE
ncbi:hypothetical protein TWF481_006948 [Arthrobotrys musiformis]|uniref:Uncharacterized protein n=1 Tax=Arthrobotrys musiformis TaxID=47236 RepID=A0AAV9WBX8_9PEZI